ncbi:hypothetical protein D3C85_408710 [compost metagenome]
MKSDPAILSLTLEASNIGFPVGISDEKLFNHFKPKIIELYQQDLIVINHFGLVPDNSADGMDDLLIDGLLFRFDVPQDVLGINLDAEPNDVKKALFAVVENKKPSSSSILEEIGATKKETTVVFEFFDL